MLVERDRPPWVPSINLPDLGQQGSPPPSRDQPNLKSTKVFWESSDTQDDEEDILDRFLKVKQFSTTQQPSCDSEFLCESHLPTYLDCSTERENC